MTTTDTLTPPQEAVRPLIRGLTVLRALAAAGGRRSVGDLVRDAALARSTVDRSLSTLQRMGYLRLEGRDAVLTPRLMEVGNAYLAACRLPGLLGSSADRLADRLDESVSLAVPDGDGVRFVHQVHRRRAMSIAFRIGDLLPAERCAPGALFAADWEANDWDRWERRRASDPEDTLFPVVPPGDGSAAASFADRTAAARERGWSLDDQLIEPGLVAIAAPVRDADGRTVCSVSVVSHTSRHSPQSLREAVLPPLRETVGAMEDALQLPVPPAGPADDAAGAAAWTRASKQELGPEFVESLARGLAVLSAFTEGREALPLTAVAEATGLARATARRALITLQHLGYMTSHDGLFSPTPRVLELGFPQLSRLTLPEIAEPHLAELVARVHDSASMAVLDGDDILYVARVPTVRIMSVDVALGSRFPAYATSLGRVLLADLTPAERTARLERASPKPITRHTITDPRELADVLDRVDREGHALVDEELEEGLRSIAVPVHDRTGRVIAAVNVALHAGRYPAEQSLRELLPHLREAAAAVEADLRVAGRFARIRNA
ncbi:IclR family transcriptional regulator domain-containing protein [Streptomyces sp. 7N604]|uniref:IclR family transcriptional regulator domain-containing protein n=1 Tax=Streptomyces sp. 7N604 TaxID=3457415 RepID=UPI003FD2993F